MEFEPKEVRKNVCESSISFHSVRPRKSRVNVASIAPIAKVESKPTILIRQALESSETFHSNFSQ
jgi:hypothetical protein